MTNDGMSETPGSRTRSTEPGWSPEEAPRGMDQGRTDADSRAGCLADAIAVMDDASKTLRALRDERDRLDATLTALRFAYFWSHVAVFVVLREACRLIDGAVQDLGCSTDADPSPDLIAATSWLVDGE